MSLAWHIAALSRRQRLPKHDSMMLKSAPRRRERQTPQQMLNIVKALNAAHGGRVEKRTKH